MSDKIHVMSAWSRVAPPGAPVVGGYVTIMNMGSEADRLLGATSIISSNVQIHQSTIVEGVARMRPVKDGVPIVPGDTVTFEPGGLHLMFLNPSNRPKDGETFSVTLIFEKAGAINVAFTARQGSPLPDDNKDHSHTTDGSSP